MIEWKYAGGSVNEALPLVQQRLNGFLASADRIYIGATTNPRTRWEHHSENGWDKMVLLFKSAGPKATWRMERAAIAYARRCNFRLKPDNILAGGESIRNGSDEYFVYVLVERW